MGVDMQEDSKISEVKHDRDLTAQTIRDVLQDFIEKHRAIESGMLRLISQDLKTAPENHGWKFQQ